MRPTILSAVHSLIFLLFASCHALAASEGSDSFANAPSIQGIFSVERLTNTDNFTKETGEPSHSDLVGGQSAWWKWTAVGNGYCTVETIRTNNFVDTAIAVYTGTSLNALTRVAASENLPGTFMSKVTFFATAGSTYRIAVESSGLGDAAEVLMQLRFVATKALRVVGNWQSPSQDTIIGGNGFLSLAITKSGAVTGYLIKGTTRYPIRSVRTIEGYVVASIPQRVTPNNPEGGPITIVLDLLFVGDFLLNPGNFTVVDGAGVHGLGTAVEVGTYTTANPANQAGTYNLGLKFSSNNTGLGYAIARVTSLGAVRFTGACGDGQKLSASSFLSANNFVPIHQGFQGGAGFFNGRFFVASGGDSFASNPVSRYRRVAAPSSPFYPNGITSNFTAAGARYVKPAPGERAAGFLNASNGAGKLVTLDAPGELGTLTEMLTFTTQNKFLFTSATRKPVLRLKPATGLVSGSIVAPAGTTRILRGLLTREEGAYRVRGYVGGKLRTAGFLVEP